MHMCRYLGRNIERDRDGPKVQKLFAWVLIGIVTRSLLFWLCIA